MELVTSRQDLSPGLSGPAFVKAVAPIANTIEGQWPKDSGSQSEGNETASLALTDHLDFPPDNELPAKWPSRYCRLCCETAAMTIVRMKSGSNNLLEYVVNTVSVEMLRCIREMQTVLRAVFGMNLNDDEHKRRIATVLDADHETITKRSRLTYEKQGLEKIKATIEAKSGSWGDEWGDL